MKLRINKDNRLLVVCGVLTVLSTVLSRPMLAQQRITQALPDNIRITKNEVIAVQVELRRLGFLKTRLSAELDPETREAVKAYQSKNGLPVTGKIDPSTYRMLGLPYPAPKPGEKAPEKTAVQQIGNGVKEGTRTGLEKTWDAGEYAAGKSKDAAKASWGGAKVAGSAAKKKADSMIRRNDEDVAPEVADVFASEPQWRDLNFTVKDGMVTIKLPPKSTVDIGTLVSEVRKVAGVRYVFVVVL